MPDQKWHLHSLKIEDSEEQLNIQEKEGSESDFKTHTSSSAPKGTSSDVRGTSSSCGKCKPQPQLDSYWFQMQHVSDARNGRTRCSTDCTDTTASGWVRGQGHMGVRVRLGSGFGVDEVHGIAWGRRGNSVWVLGGNISCKRLTVCFDQVEVWINGTIGPCGFSTLKLEFIL
nr:hypothetical protein [Tanacetum cinerariifolium]